MFRFYCLLAILFFFSTATSAAPIKIGVSETMLSLPFFIAQSEGFFRKRGVEVEFERCFGGHRCLKGMLEGQTALATSAELPVVFNSFERDDFAILASFVTASNNVKLVARSANQVSSPAQLRNLKIGYMKGSTSQYVLDTLLVFSGVDPDSLKLVPITAEDALQALKNGEIDAVSIWEPFASKILLDLKGQTSLVPMPRLYTETFNLVSTRHILETRPRELEKILAALRDSTDFIQNNPQKAKELVANRFGLPAEVIERIGDDYRFRLSLNRGLTRTMEGQARWAIREGHVPGNPAQPNFSRFLHADLLRKVDPSAVSLQ